MLPDYLTSYNPLKERLSGKNSSADQQKIKTALQQILDGKAGGPEFGAVMGSAEAKALRMLGGNTGRFAGNYVLKNYDKLDPMVKDMVPLYGKDIVETEGALEKQKEMPVLPRVVESARRRQSERRAKAVERQEAKKLTLDEIRRKHKKAVREEPDGGVSQEGAYEEEFINSFVGRPAKKRRAFSASQNPDTENDMDNIGYQEGGMVPVDGEGNMPPEAVASDVVNGAPMGMVDVPNGGGPVDDGVPTELPEGTVVINAAAIRLHGTETIDNLINTAVDELLSEGVQISMEDPNPNDNVPVAISNGEYVIPPEVAEKIGYKKLEDMNERGRAYLQKQAAQEKQQAEAQQQPQQPTQQPPESFMGESMPPQQEGPPPAPVQSEQQAMAMMGMMSGGRVPLDKSEEYREPNPQYKIKPGTTGTPEFPRDYVRVSEEELLLEQQQQREAKKANVLPQRNADGGRVQLEGGGGLARAKDAFINWFSSTYLGDKMDPAESAVDKMLMVPTAPEGKVTVGDAPSTGLPDALAGKSFKSIGDMDYGDGGRYQRAFDEARKADVSPASTKENPQYRNAPSQRKKADGGRVNYAAGATARVNAPEAPSLIDNFMDTLRTGIERLTGGSFESTAEPPQYEPAPRQNPDRGASFKSAVDPLYDSTLAELGPTTQFRSNVQRAAEGGFVGDYNYAQPQQATMGTPFPNAVDSNPQQSQSFLRPNDAKKKSRVELADGEKVNSPEEQINTEGKIAVGQQEQKIKSFADQINTEGKLAATQYEQKDRDARETLANDRTFQFEMGGGDAQATANIIKGNEEHKVANQVVYDGRYLVSYMDNAKPPRRTIGGINQDALPDDHPLRDVERVLPADYIEHHQKHLQEANDWVTNNPSYEPIREVIVDMKFNMKPSGFKQFVERNAAGDKPRFRKAVEEGNFDVASKELLIGKNENSPSSYVEQVPNRAKANSKRLKLLGQQFFKEKYPDITENQYTNNISFSTKAEDMSMEPSDSFVPLPVKSSESVGQRAAKQNAKNAEKQKAIYDTRTDQTLMPSKTSDGFKGFENFIN